MINSELIVLFDQATKLRRVLKMPLKIFFAGCAKIWPGWEIVPPRAPKCHRKPRLRARTRRSREREWLARKSVVSLTSRRQLRTLANTFVVVRVLCAEIASWLPNAAYFARGSTVAFKVYPVEGKGKNEGRGGSLLLACSSKGNIPLTHCDGSYLHEP